MQFNSGLTREDDDLKMCLHIAPDEDKVVDVEILDHQYPIVEWQSFYLTTKPQFDPTKPLEDDYMNRVTRSNGNKRFFRTLMGVLSIFDREDLKAIYELVMEQYQDEIPEGFDKMLWGDLIIMFNQDDYLRSYKLVSRGFFEKQKLTGPNFIDWYRKLRIVLSVEDKLDYLERPIPPALSSFKFGQQVALEALAAHTAWVKGSKEITELMRMIWKTDIPTTLDILKGQSVSSCVLNMKSYIDNLERLGHPVSLNLRVSLILISLRKEFDSFMQNYNMHSMGKMVNELHAMLKLHEQTLTKKDPALHAIRAGKF
ncbi:hypothetical protein Tco_0713854 [Tanacetum coccineum]